MKHFIVTAIALSCATLPLAAKTASTTPPVVATNRADQIRTRLSALKGQHPRLVTDSATLPKNLGDRSAYMDELIKESQHLLSVPTLTRKMDGRRLLATSREALRRINTLVPAYLYTRNPEFFKRAESELLAVCAFSDWNKKHYLDVAEMSLAVALGYDFLYHDLSPESRETIATGLWEHGLKTAIPDELFFSSKNNWGQVCNAGMTAAAIALADRHPEDALLVIDRAFEKIPNSMNAFRPDGVYPEGPMYWDYGTSFNAVFVMIAEHVFSTSFRIAQQPGFVDSAKFMCHATGSTGLVFNYADGHTNLSAMPTLLWMFDHFDTQLGGRQSPAVEAQYKALTQTPEILIKNRLGGLFYIFGLKPQPSSPFDSTAVAPLDFHGRGPSEIITLRSAWSEPSAWYIGIKAGTPRVNHGHMDAGSFILDAKGIRWAHEAGGESYGLLEKKGYKLWDSSQNGDRWNVFRYGIQSHNLPVINDKRQAVSKSAIVTQADINTSSPVVTLDLSDLYACNVTRTFTFKNRDSLIIRDSFVDLESTDSVRWQMLTDAAASARGNALTLTQDEQTLTLTVNKDVTWKIEETSSLYNTWDTPQPNRRRVSFMLPPAETTLDYTVTIQ